MKINLHPFPHTHTLSLNTIKHTHSILKLKSWREKKETEKVLQPSEEHQEESNIAGFPGSTPDLIQCMSTTHKSNTAYIVLQIFHVKYFSSKMLRYKCQRYIFYVKSLPKCNC